MSPIYLLVIFRYFFRIVNALHNFSQNSSVSNLMENNHKIIDNQNVRRGLTTAYQYYLQAMSKNPSNFNQSRYVAICLTSKLIKFGIEVSNRENSEKFAKYLVYWLKQHCAKESNRNGPMLISTLTA